MLLSPMLGSSGICFKTSAGQRGYLSSTGESQNGAGKDKIETRKTQDGASASKADTGTTKPTTTDNQNDGSEEQPETHESKNRAHSTKNQTVPTQAEPRELRT